MRFYSIFFSSDNYPVYEGREGKYWLGGMTKNLSYLIFTSKKGAEAGLESIKIRIKAFESPDNIFMREMDKLHVKRCELQAI